MPRFRFSGDAARPITDYGSAFHLARLFWSRVGEVHVDIAFLEPGDRIELHQAGLPQLLCVITGAGWVQGGDRREAAISGGEAVYWPRGEWHAHDSANDAFF